MERGKCDLALLCHAAELEDHWPISFDLDDSNLRLAEESAIDGDVLKYSEEEEEEFFEDEEEDEENDRYNQLSSLARKRGLPSGWSSQPSISRRKTNDSDEDYYIPSRSETRVRNLETNPLSPSLWFNKSIQEQPEQPEQGNDVLPLPLAETQKAGMQKPSYVPIMTMNWVTHMEELKEFKKQYGHCNVSRKNMQWKSLGHWVRQQRRKRKNGKLNETQIDILEKMGFEWDRSYYLYSKVPHKGALKEIPIQLLQKQERKRARDSKKPQEPIFIEETPVKLSDTTSTATNSALGRILRQQSLARSL